MGILIIIVLYFGYNLFSNYDGHSVVSDHVTKNTKIIHGNLSSTTKILVKHENSNAANILNTLSNMQTNNIESFMETNKNMVE